MTISGNSVTEFTGEEFYLSNFADSPIVYRGEVYATNEHLYNALKTVRGEQREWIRKAHTPGEAKKRGRQATLRPGWDEGVKFDCMELGLRLKFGPTSYLLNRLQRTAGLTLQEGNWWGDKIWGVDLKTGEGENHLGRLLMKIRDQSLQVY